MALTWPTEQDGSSGENVTTIQYLLVAKGHATGVDGVFGPQTQAAVEAFQSSRGLGVDGIVGDATWPPLLVQTQQGATGDAVRAVQSQIHTRGDGAQAAVDGVFGRNTNDAVRAFQSLLGFSVDGIAGPETWNYLVNGYLAAPDPQAAAQAVFSAWESHNRAQAGKNATPSGVSAVFAQAFSAGDGWSFEGCDGALGHVFCAWKRSNGTKLRIGVIDAVEGPYYPVDQAAFT